MVDVTRLDIDIEASASGAADALDKVVSGLDDAAKSLKDLSVQAKNLGLSRAAKDIEGIAQVAGVTSRLKALNAQIGEMADNYDKAGNALVANMLRQNSNLLETEKRLKKEEDNAKAAANAEKKHNQEAVASKRAAENNKRFAALQTYRAQSLLLRKQANESAAANKTASLAEKTRHNKESELISRVKAEYANKAKMMELQQREVSNAERTRHNKAMEELRSEANAEKKAADEARNRNATIRETGKAISSVLGSLNKGKGILKNFSNVFGKLARKAKEAFGNIGSSLKNMLTLGGGKALGKLRNFIKAIGRIALYRAIRSMIKAITQGFSEGIKNLYAYSELIGTKFKPSMDKMATAALYVKNAFAAMAAPLINTVAPIIDMIGDKVAALANKMAEFLSALTGQNVYTRAIKYAQAYNDELDETSKKLDRWLGSFDEINRMNDNGGSGNGNNVDYSRMFEEAVVSTEMSELARKIIEAFQSADLSPIGRALGEKLKNSLESIDWAAIKAKAERIALQITSFINGGLSTEGVGKSIGKTIAEALNTAVTFAATFAATLNWSELGKAIGESIRSFIQKFDFAKAGRGFGDFAIGILNALKSAIDELNKKDNITGLSGWDELGEKIADALAGIRFGEILSGTVSIGINIVKGILSSISAFLEESEKNGFWDELGSGIGDALASIDWVNVIGKIGKIGVGILKGVFQSIKTAVSKGFGIDDESASFIVDALAVGLLTAKVAKLFGKTKALTGGFQDKNKQLSQQTELTEAETAAATDLSGVFGKQSSAVLPGLIGSLVMTVGAIGSLTGKSETAANGISAWFSSAMDKIKAKSDETVHALNPLNTEIKSNIPQAFEQMGGALNKHISSAESTLGRFRNSIDSIPNSMKSMVDNTKENLEITARNEESYMKVEGKNWQAFQQHRADSAATSARSVQKINAALKNNWAIPAAAVIAGVAIGALMHLGGGTVNGAKRGIGSAQFNNYANGGFPSAGSLFVAGEGNKNPEFVGNLGGQTGVWNSDQLVQAMYAAMNQALANNAQNGNIYLDGEVIYRNVVNRNNNQVRATGRTALLT